MTPSPKTEICHRAPLSWTVHVAFVLELTVIRSCSGPQDGKINRTFKKRKKKASFLISTEASVETGSNWYSCFIYQLSEFHKWTLTHPAASDVTLPFSLLFITVLTHISHEIFACLLHDLFSFTCWVSAGLPGLWKLPHTQQGFATSYSRITCHEKWKTE